MRKALSEDQVRAYLGSIVREYKSHGKDITMEEIKAFVKERLADRPPYLGAFCVAFEDRDYETLLQVIEYNQSQEDIEAGKDDTVAAAGEKRERLRAAQAEEKAKVVEEEELEDPELEDEIDLSDIEDDEEEEDEWEDEEEDDDEEADDDL